MYYIGTSLGKCLVSILRGEVSERQVIFIVTGTSCRSYEQFVQVVDTYYKNGNYYVKDPSAYDTNGISEDEYKLLAQRLWESGRIHQPNLSPESYQGPFSNMREELWLQVVPTLNNSTPAVVEAYEKYKVLDNLTKDEPRV